MTPKQNLRQRSKLSHLYPFLGELYNPYTVKCILGQMESYSATPEYAISYNVVW